MIDILGWSVVVVILGAFFALGVFVARRGRAIDEAPLASLMREGEPSPPSEGSLELIARSNAFQLPEPRPPPEPAPPPARASEDVKRHAMGPERGFLDLSVEAACVRAQTRLTRLADPDPSDERSLATSGSARDWALVRLAVGGRKDGVAETAAVLSDLAAAGCIAFDSGKIVLLDADEPHDELQRAALRTLGERASRSGRIRLGDCLAFVTRLEPAPRPGLATEAGEVWARVRQAVDTGTCPDRRTAILVRLLRIEAYLQPDRGPFWRLRNDVAAALLQPDLDERQQQVAILFDRELPSTLAAMLTPYISDGA